MADKQYTDRLSKTLVNYVANLVDGNNASAKDVIDKGHRDADAIVSLYIQWDFSAETNDSTTAGGQGASRHFGANLTGFKEHSQNLVNDANYDLGLRKNFLNNLNARGVNGILDASQSSHVVHNFSTFSYHFNCGSCHGKGRVTCYSCSGSGRNFCYACSGTGSIGFQEPVYRNGQPAGYRWSYRSCSSCFASGQITCSGCGGGGIVNCRSCSGYGFFTKYRNISVIASTSYSIGVASQIKGIKLRDYMLTKNLRYCYDNLKFKFLDNYKLNSNSHEFHYEAQTLVMEHEVQILNYTYKIDTFADALNIFSNNHFFNELLSKEINNSSKINSLKSSQRKLLLNKYFEDFKDVEILNDSMKEIAISKSDKSINSANIVFKKCKTHISFSNAEILANTIEKILDRVSPTYSKVIWGMFFLLGLTYTFFYAEYMTEFSQSSTINAISSSRAYVTDCGLTDGNCWTYENGKTITALGSLLKNTIIIILLGVVAVILSKWSTSHFSKKLNPEYKQVSKNRKPLKKFITASLVAYFLGTCYGHISNEGSFPKLKGFLVEDLQIAVTKQFSPICTLSNYNTPKQNRSVACDFLSAEINNFYAFDNSVSNKNKILFIQKFLNSEGYKVGIDGARGPQTDKVIRDYVSADQNPFTEKGTIYTDDLYAFFKSREQARKYYEEHKENIFVKYLIDKDQRKFQSAYASELVEN